MTIGGPWLLSADRTRVRLTPSSGIPHPFLFIAASTPACTSLANRRFSTENGRTASYPVTHPALFGAPALK